jgi:tripartite-type tricarboxylate transporter receptor subunit TctC
MIPTRALALAALVIFLAAPVSAYPTKAIEVVVPFPAGGRTDIIARQFAATASKHLGQQMVVVNKVGGGGAVGTAAVIGAPPDGYTLIATTIGNQILRPLSAQVPYRYDQLSAIGQIAASPLGLATRPDRPWKSLQELAADAKKRPNEISFAANLLLLPHLTVAAYAERAGVQLKHVPQTGDAPGITAALGGHIDLVVSANSTLVSHVKSGALRVLGTFSAARDPALPDVPTAKEQGYAVIGEPWTGLAAPPSTPADVLAKLRSVFAAVMKDPEFLAGMQKIGEEPRPLDHVAFAARWKQDWDEFEKIVKALKK